MTVQFRHTIMLPAWLSFLDVSKAWPFSYHEGKLLEASDASICIDVLLTMVLICFANDARLHWRQVSID